MFDITVDDVLEVFEQLRWIKDLLWIVLSL